MDNPQLSAGGLENATPAGFEWAEKNYPDRVFPRSACIFCPYRSNSEWLALTPAELDDAKEFDREIRSADLDGQKSGVRKMLVGVPYLHRSLKPLSEVDLSSDGPGLWDGVAENECAGMCGV